MPRQEPGSKEHHNHKREESLRERITSFRGEGAGRRSQEDMDVIVGACSRQVPRDVRKGLDTQCRQGGTQISADLVRQSKEGLRLPAFPTPRIQPTLGKGSSVSSVLTFNPATGRT